MTSPRPYHGVFMTAPVGAVGAPGTWSVVYNGSTDTSAGHNDLRGTYPGHDIYQERIGDYVYAAATATYGLGVWTDAQNATVCGPVDSVLLMGGRSVLSLINTGLALVVNVVLDVILVPKIGIEGAALGWSAGILVNNLLPLWQVNRTMGMHPFGPGARTAMSVCVVTFGFVPGLVYVALGQSLLSLLLALLLASATFLLAVTKLRAPLEVDDLVRALRRRRPVNGR